MIDEKKKITSRNVKTILFVFLIVAMILPFSMTDFTQAMPNEKEKKKTPDMTDYVSQYRDVDKKIRDNKKQIDADTRALEDKSVLPDMDIAKIEYLQKRINDKKAENDRLWKEAAEIERLNRVLHLG